MQVCRCRAASQLEAREERLTQADASRADAQTEAMNAQKRGELQKSILLEAKEKRTAAVVANNCKGARLFFSHLRFSSNSIANSFTRTRTVEFRFLMHTGLHTRLAIAHAFVRV